MQAHQLPMAGHCIFADGSLGHFAIEGQWRFGWRNMRQVRDIAQTERLQIRKLDCRYALRNMAERVRARVAEAFRIRKLSDSYAIHDHDTYSFKHVYHSSSLIQVV